MTLEDKVAIVTGASRGIGKAISVGFAKEGAHVVVAARSDKEEDEESEKMELETEEESEEHVSEGIEEREIKKEQEKKNKLAN